MNLEHWKIIVLMQITFWKFQVKVFFRLKHSVGKTRRYKSRQLIPYLLG